MKDIQNINKIRTTMTTTIAIVLLVMALVTAAVVIVAPYGIEEAEAQAFRPDEAVVLAGTASEEARSLAINIAIEQLLNMTSPSITFRADGTFSISQMDMTPEVLYGNC